jgi:site-specific DNA-methyltransferase (adenine-specific)
MNTALMFSSKSDEWSTPQDTFDRLHAEFDFDCDVAANAENAKSDNWFGEGGISPDALSVEWFPMTCWLNPPYSRGLQGKFIAKAASEAAKGCTVVMLIPARTDTKAFHAHIWDEHAHRPRPGVEVRFLRGRLKFGGCKDAAPFPSMVVIFRGVRA